MMYLRTALLSLLLAAGCVKVERPKEQNVRLQPGSTLIDLQPSHKRVELRSAKSGRKILDIDVYQDERRIQISRDAQDIQLRNR